MQLRDEVWKGLRISSCAKPGSSDAQNSGRPGMCGCSMWLESPGVALLQPSLRGLEVAKNRNVGLISNSGFQFHNSIATTASWT
jgi:hypothetical protein